MLIKQSKANSKFKKFDLDSRMSSWVFDKNPALENPYRRIAVLQILILPKGDTAIIEYEELN